MNINIQIDRTDEGVMYAVMTESDDGEVIMIGSGQNDDIASVLAVIKQLVERTLK